MDVHIGENGVPEVTSIVRELETEVINLEDAIREHRATKTPQEWSPADKKLYQHLPELKEGIAGARG